MASTVPDSSNGAPITEEEAALYDRQLRLWGVEAQRKMQNAAVLIYGFRGLAAEIAKNIVLAGVGKVTLLDEQDITEVDLGANFFLREEDVSQKRVEAGAPRVQALNPRVQLSTQTSLALLDDEAFLSAFDLIVLTDVDAPTLLRVNTLTRKLSKKLYAASSIGMDGWIFADLLEHEFLLDKAGAQGESAKITTKHTKNYVPFELALTHKWDTLKARQLKRISPTVWAVLVLFATQTASPSTPVTTESLSATAATLLPSLGLKVDILPESTLSRIAATVPFEFPPSAAILGGIAGQDVLNTLGGKEEPVRNFMAFDGETGAGNVWALGL